MVCLPQETYQKLRYPSSPELTAPAFESRDERALQPSAVQPSAVDALWASEPAALVRKGRQSFPRVQGKEVPNGKRYDAAPGS